MEISDPELCNLYAGRVITGIKIVPSPMRIRHRLHAVGVRPISNIVDVTNYILFECGQPLHSFDLDKLKGGRIIVSPAAQGEKFVTLDGQERTLDARDLCIRDAERAVGLAGVMGGLNTEIDENSSNVFLESAVFRPGTIRKTSRRLGLSSEASYRFERGIDHKRAIWSLDRACAMMVAAAGGKVCPGYTLAEPRPFVPVQIEFRPARANALLGVELSPAFDEKVLSGMGCAITKTSDDSWQVTQPSWRPDLTREADLIEEVGRVHGPGHHRPRAARLPAGPGPRRRTHVHLPVLVPPAPLGRRRGPQRSRQLQLRGPQGSGPAGPARRRPHLHHEPALRRTGCPAHRAGPRPAA